jgi:hypothetical protein
VKRYRSKALLASLVAVAGILGADAGATTLDVLVGGATLTSDAGDLLFSNFDATPSGSLSADLSLYDISALSGQEGVVITGPFSLSNGEVGVINIEFDVSFLTGGLFLNGAGLDFSGTIVDGLGLEFTSVSEDLLDGPLPGGSHIPGDADLAVLALVGGAFTGSDTAAFDSILSLHVFKGISITTTGTGQVTIDSIEETFSVIPEPATAALMILGLLGLASLGRR